MNYFNKFLSTIKDNLSIEKSILIGLFCIMFPLVIILISTTQKIREQRKDISELKQDLKSSQLSINILESEDDNEEEKELEIEDIAPKLDLTNIGIDYYFYKKWVTKRPYDEEKGQQGIKKIITVDEKGEEKEYYEFDDIKLLSLGISASVPIGEPSYESDIDKYSTGAYVVFTLRPSGYYGHCGNSGCDQSIIKKQADDYTESGGLWVEQFGDFTRILSPSQIKKDIGIDLLDNYFSISNIGYLGEDNIIVSIIYCRWRR